MKSIYLALLAISFSFSLYAQGVVSQNGRLRVRGNTIHNENNVPYSVAGNSFFWSGFENDGGFFYQGRVVNHLARQWNSQVVRAAMAVEQADGGRGFVNNPDAELARVRRVVDAAIANDIYVIIDFHTHNAENHLSEARTFFRQMVREYGDNDHVIYEIYNEPIGGFGDQSNTWNNVIRPYANQVISTIRNEERRLGYSRKLIIVGTPFFSQGVDVASQNPINNSVSNNIAYTLHFYAGTHSQSLRNRATTALNNGIALFVTEWGTVNADGNGSPNVSETNTWMRFLKQNNISHANWSVSDKAEGASIISAGQRVNGLTSNNLTSSGNLVRCIVEKWNTETSYSNCDTSGNSTGGGGGTPPNPGPCAGVSPPNAPATRGVKVQVETPVGNTDSVSGARSDFRSSGLSVSARPSDCEAIVAGYRPGQATSFRIRTNQNTRYTFRVTLSSTASNYTLELQRNGGASTLSSTRIPNTGNLNSYRNLTINNVSLPNGFPDIALAIGGNGSGTVNIESFTYFPSSSTPPPPPSGQLIANGTYFINSPFSSNRLVDTNAGFGNRDVRSENNTNNRGRWVFNHLGNDVYTIRNVGTNRFLEVPNAQCANGSNVATWRSASSNHQRWHIVRNNGSFSLRPTHCRERALDRSAGRLNTNAQIWIFRDTNRNQRWNIQRVNGSKVLENNSGLFKIFPNPSSDLITISNENEGDLVTISNALGVVVKSVILNSDEEKLSVVNLADGMYFITINGTTAKFIKK